VKMTVFLKILVFDIMQELAAEQCWTASHLPRASPAGETHAGLKNARSKTAHLKMPPLKARGRLARGQFCWQSSIFADMSFLRFLIFKVTCHIKRLLLKPFFTLVVRYLSTAPHTKGRNERHVRTRGLPERGAGHEH